MASRCIFCLSCVALLLCTVGPSDGGTWNREFLQSEIFSDGFESGDTTAWFNGCAVDVHCALNQHCDGVCVDNLGDGSTCDEDGDCVSGYCQNGFCCQFGDCCSFESDCPASYSQEPTCTSATTCQGDRIDTLCSDSICESSGAIDDDSGCGPGILANDCSFYLDLYCDGTADQTPPICPSSCTLDSDCDPIAHCDGSTCQPDLPDGTGCDENGDCISGHCQNGFCCAGGECCGTAGADEIRACGNCGTQTRFCGSDFIWSNWGSCSGEGDCTPSSTRPCNLCGTQTCSESCIWQGCDFGVLDGYEENDIQNSAHVFPPISDDDADQITFLANINPAYDDDWYRVYIQDTVGYLHEVVVELDDLPVGQTYELFALYECDSGEGPFIETVVADWAGATATINSNDCETGGFLDSSGTLYIRVRPVTAGSCVDYMCKIHG